MVGGPRDGVTVAPGVDSPQSMVYMRSVEWGLFSLSKGDQVSTSISGVVTKSMMLDVSTRSKRRCWAEGKNGLPITGLGSVEGGDRKLDLDFLHPTGELSELVRDVGKEAAIEIFAGIAVGLPVLCHRVRVPSADTVLFHWRDPFLVSMEQEPVVPMSVVKESAQKCTYRFGYAK